MFNEDNPVLLFALIQLRRSERPLMAHPSGAVAAQ
jgi:hypothetical protein